VKTTIEIADPLFRAARQRANKEGITLRALVERGLHRVLSEAEQSPAFKLRRASFKGRGLRPELRDASWDRMHDLAYEDRGD